MAIACLVERAPCSPRRILSISACTNSPAWVEGDLPSRASCRAFSMVSLSGMLVLIVTLHAPRRRRHAIPTPWNRGRSDGLAPSIGQRRGEDSRGVQRLASGAVLDLVAAARAGSDENGVHRRTAHLGQHAELADPERHVVMLGLVAEGAGHAAAGAVEGLDPETRHQLQGRDAVSHGVERLLVAMPV